MITKAKFTNFKLLREVEFSLERVSVIVGANGVGKSTALEGLSLLLATAERLREQGDSRTTGDAVDAVFTGDTAPQWLASQPGESRFELGVTIGTEHRVHLSTERLSGKDRQWRSVLAYEGSLGSEVTDTHYEIGTGGRIAGKIQQSGVRSCALLRLDALRLREPHYSPERDVRMAFDGEGLSSVLQRIQIARDGRLEIIEREVARTVPLVRRIRTTQEPVARIEQVPVTIDGKGTFVPHRREYVGAGFEVEWGDVGWVSSRQLSEGTLLIIGLATLLHQKPPSLLLIDDIDKALHPTAQTEVVRMLLRCIDANPSLQVLATTHSPFVVDALEPHQVLVAGSVDSRTTAIRPLTEHSSWTRRKGHLHPGEFWSAVGESWVAEKKE